METYLWIAIIFILFYDHLLVAGYYDYIHPNIQKEKSRMQQYVEEMVEAWIPTIMILLLVGFTDLTLENIGLGIPTINTETLGKAITYIGFAISLFYFSILVFTIIVFQFSSKRIKNNLGKQKTQELRKLSYSNRFPVTKVEKKLWNLVSLTAGITEEIIYRGFLIFAISYLFPNLSIWLVLLIASFIFGLGHKYQGMINGVLRTTAIGFLFSIIYIGLESIIPLILLHFLQDYTVKLGNYDDPYTEGGNS